MASTETPAAAPRRALVWLYAAQVTLFMTHEVDSARWEEWELFRMPAPVFVLVHLLAMALVLWGFAGVLRGARAGSWLGLMWGAFGPVALGIHGYFLLNGHEGFRAPESLALIGGMVVVGLALMAVSVGALRKTA